jgi:hypothetical protein
VCHSSTGAADGREIPPLRRRHGFALDAGPGRLDEGGLQDWFVLRKDSKELTEQDGLNRGFRYSAIRQKPQIVGLKEEIVAVCTIEGRRAQLMGGVHN